MTNAAALTFERDAPSGGNQHRRDHELWLAMQAAHDQWTIAGGVLDDLVAIVSSDIDSPDVSLQIAKAAEEERSAFWALEAVLEKSLPVFSPNYAVLVEAAKRELKGENA